jgi:hypothetical protein
MNGALSSSLHNLKVYCAVSSFYFFNKFKGSESDMVIPTDMCA